MQGGRSFISWVWRDSHLSALDKLIADLMTLPASLLVMRLVCCFRIVSVSCRLAISEFLYLISAILSTGLIITIGICWKREPGLNCASYAQGLTSDDWPWHTYSGYATVSDPVWDIHRTARSDRIVWPAGCISFNHFGGAFISTCPSLRGLKIQIHVCGTYVLSVWFTLLIGYGSVWIFSRPAYCLMC